VYQGALANLGLSADPLTGNRYALAAGNPVSYMELDGHRPVEDGTGAGSRTPSAGRDPNRAYEPPGSYQYNQPPPHEAHYVNGKQASFNRTTPDGRFDIGSSPKRLLEICGVALGGCEIITGIMEGSVSKIAWGAVGIIPIGKAARYADEGVNTIRALGRQVDDSDGPTTLYRAVSKSEMDDIREHRVFRAGTGMTGKMFAEEAEDARAWGRWFYKDAPFHIVGVEAPRNLVTELKYWERLDNIGPARYVDESQLDQFNSLLHKIWEVQ
jgi:hypothetical protein